MLDLVKVAVWLDYVIRGCDQFVCFRFYSPDMISMVKTTL
jgi:hypothetical protein